MSSSPPLFEVRTDTQHSRGLESVGAAPGAAPDFAPTVVGTALLGTPSAASQQSSPEVVLKAAPELIRRRYRKLRKGADLLLALRRERWSC